MMRRDRRAGQQMTEFALVLGVAVAVAISMQFITRNALQRSIRHVSDTVLQVPAEDEEARQASLDVTASQTVTETGEANFRRVTETTESVVGSAVNEDARLRIRPFQ